MKTFPIVLLWSLCVIPSSRAQDQPAKPLNVVIILTDDQGYNDVGCYGSPLIKTPRLDAMAEAGTLFTDAYAAAPVCTPSRAGLMTGCHPQRLGLMEIHNGRRDRPDRVLYPLSPLGLNSDEVTIAEILRDRGYATMCVGKWHLGDAEPFLPTNQGFDHWFGMPYSNDMNPSVLMRDTEIVEDPAVHDTMLERYTDESVKFIAENHDRPFFLYLAHNMPHTPLTITERFRGKSERGLYGDVIQAIDWSVGQVLDELARHGVEEHTLVIFTSDNGPWHIRGEEGGSATPLRAGKGTTYEGGMRVPFIARCPDLIPAGTTTSEPITHMDLLPTIANLVGASVPDDRVIDGKDITPILRGEPDARSPHEALFYYGNGCLNCIRSGPWKLKLPTTLQEETMYGRYEQPDAIIPKRLYNLVVDIGEQKSVLQDHPKIAERLERWGEAARQEIGDERTDTVGTGARPIGRIDHAPVKPGGGSRNP